jgi:hypothetical protein
MTDIVAVFVALLAQCRVKHGRALLLASGRSGTVLALAALLALVIALPLTFTPMLPLL